MNRDLKGYGNKQEYAREEITAELASVFVSAALGIAPQDMGQHAAYLAFWIEAMKADPRYLYQRRIKGPSCRGLPA